MLQNFVFRNQEELIKEYKNAEHSNELKVINLEKEIKLLEQKFKNKTRINQEDWQIVKNAYMSGWTSNGGLKFKMFETAKQECLQLKGVVNPIKLES